MLFSYVRFFEEFWEMYFRIIDVREERGKYLFFSFYCLFVKVCFVGVNFFVFFVYKFECLVRFYECMIKLGVFG